MNWRKIEEFPRYSVSDEGQVRNDKTGRILKAHHDRFGYLQLNLSNAGVKKKKYVHRLAAEAFIPNPDGKPEVNHKDGNKENCAVSNLEWVTPHENRLHMYRVLGVEPNRPTEEHLDRIHKLCKIATSKPVRCVETGIEYDSMRTAASSTGTTEQKISYAVKNRGTAGGYHWELVNREGADGK